MIFFYWHSLLYRVDLFLYRLFICCNMATESVIEFQTPTKSL